MYNIHQNLDTPVIFGQKLLNSSTRYFLTLCYILILAGSAWMYFTPKGTMVLALNAHYTDFWSMFFKYVTYLGDGVVVAIIALAFLWIRYSAAATVALLGLLQLLVIQGSKKFAFGPMERPAAFFEDALPPLQFVDGVNIHHLFTMPSGHTATAFSMAMILVLLLKPGKVGATALFLLATLIGLSRIYLAQHFLVDTLVGAAIGLILAYVAFQVFEKLRLKQPEGKFFQSSLRSLRS